MIDSFYVLQNTQSVDDAINFICEYAKANSKEETFDLLMEEVLWEVLSGSKSDYDAWQDDLEEDIDEDTLNSEREKALDEIRNEFDDIDEQDKGDAFDKLVHDVLPTKLYYPDLAKVARTLWEWKI